MIKRLIDQRRPSESWGLGFFINAAHVFTWRQNSQIILAKYYNASTTGCQLSLARRALYDSLALNILTYSPCAKVNPTLPS